MPKEAYEAQGRQNLGHEKHSTSRCTKATTVLCTAQFAGNSLPGPSDGLVLKGTNNYRKQALDRGWGTHTP